MDQGPVPQLKASSHSSVMKIWRVAAADERFDKYRAAKMQTFEIPLGGLKIRTSYVEN